MKDLQITANRKNIVITGNTMDPVIPKHSTVLLHKFKHDGKKFIDGAIYIIQNKVDGIKYQRIGRLHVLIDGYKLVPENKEYEAMEISRKEMKDFKVLGRVIGCYTGFSEYSNVTISN